MGKKPKVITAPVATTTFASSVFGADLPTRNIARAVLATPTKEDTDE